MTARRVGFVDLADLQNLVLVALFDHYMNSEEPFLGLDDIRGVVGCTGVNAIMDVLLELEENDLVQREVVVRELTNALAEITGTGSHRIQTRNFRLTRKGAQFVSAFTKEQFNELTATLLLQGTQLSPSTEDQPWQPLKIDRETAEFRRAIEIAEDAIRCIESDNGYAANEPDERNGLIATVRGTLNAVRLGWVSKEVILTGLLKPFRYLADKFSGAAIGEAGKRAFDAIMSLFS